MAFREVLSGEIVVAGRNRASVRLHIGPSIANDPGRSDHAKILLVAHVACRMLVNIGPNHPVAHELVELLARADSSNPDSWTAGVSWNPEITQEHLPDKRKFTLQLITDDEFTPSHLNLHIGGFGLFGTGFFAPGIAKSGAAAVVALVRHLALPHADPPSQDTAFLRRLDRCLWNVAESWLSGRLVVTSQDLVANRAALPPKTPIEAVASLAFHEDTVEDLLELLDQALDDGEHEELANGLRESIVNHYLLMLPIACRVVSGFHDELAEFLGEDDPELVPLAIIQAFTDATYPEIDIDHDEVKRLGIELTLSLSANDFDYDDDEGDVFEEREIAFAAVVGQIIRSATGVPWPDPDEDLLVCLESALAFRQIGLEILQAMQSLAVAGAIEWTP